MSVRPAVDPTAGGTGLGSVYIRNATDGQTDFTRVVFDDSSTPAVTERLLQVPVNLGPRNNPTRFKRVRGHYERVVGVRG
jgi:hypothetical protein